jgi:RND family efflux transporter MFP subunit
LIGFCKITAPFSGMITKRSFDPGAFVPAATSVNPAQSNPLVTLMDFSVVRLQIAVPEAEVPRIQNGLSVKVSIEELPGPGIQASITRFSHALDESTKTMLTEIDIPNAKFDLRPGMYAMARIGVEKRTNALLIPADALLVEKAGNSVFVPLENKAKKVSVKTGFDDGARVEILDGLKGDQPVLLIGKMVLNNGQPIKVLESK